MSTPIIFLDIDGVLNDEAFVAAALANQRLIAVWSPELGARMLDPIRVERLQGLCDRTGAGVVIVSGWRRWAPVEGIAACLALAGLRVPVLGAVGGVRFSGDLRAAAALDWLREHPGVTRWVVIDDTMDLWWYGWCAGRVVSPTDGLTNFDVEHAVAVLAGNG